MSGFCNDSMFMQETSPFECTSRYTVILNSVMHRHTIESIPDLFAENHSSLAAMPSSILD